MSTSKIYNFIMLALLLASGAMGFLLYVTWSHVREENAERRRDESKLLFQLNKLKEEKEYNTQYYQRLVHDEEFAERVIRERLGYASKDEIVFRFKDSTPLGVNTTTQSQPIKLDTNTEVKSQQEPKEIVKPKDQEVQQEQVEQKSLLRRLFSKDSNDTKVEKDITPQIRIDLSTNKDSENIKKPTNKNSEQVQSTNEQINQVGELKVETISIKEQSQQPPKKKTSKKRTKNSIRFRAN